MEKEEDDKKFIKNLTKHRSILFCLFELCEFIISNNKKEKKILSENNAHENNEDDNKNDVITFQKFLMNIFSYNNIKNINEMVKENDNLKNNSLQSDDAKNFLETHYNDVIELNETVHNLYLFLKLTKIISFTDV
ncbi:conserved Plasmodium protein, unknown function [Plasmodium malariae]|nr:conserved Plasmodium protein, unknown function [Plasmodium malariae]